MPNQNALRDSNRTPTMLGVTSTGDIVQLQVTTEGKLKVDAELEVSDIQIGAVEIKDATTANRVVVDTNHNLHVSVAELNGNYNKIRNANDYVQTYTYGVGLLADNIATIVHSSVTLSLSVTETFNWIDADHLNTITLS